MVYERRQTCEVVSRENQKQSGVWRQKLMQAPLFSAVVTSRKVPSQRPTRSQLSPPPWPAAAAVRTIRRRNFMANIDCGLRVQTDWTLSSG